MGRLWDVVDDRAVWEALGAKARSPDGTLVRNPEVVGIVKRLAEQLNRGVDAICYRVEHLHDPKHVGHVRLFSADGGPPLSAQATEPPPVPAAGEPTEGSLMSALTSFRLRVALAANLDPYRILHNSVLQQIADRCPQNEHELKVIFGIGNKKYRDYGTELLRICKKFAAAPVAAPAGLAAPPQPFAASTPGGAETPCGKRTATETAAGSSSGIATMAVTKRAKPPADFDPPKQFDTFSSLRRLGFGRGRGRGD